MRDIRTVPTWLAMLCCLIFGGLVDQFGWGTAIGVGLGAFFYWGIALAPIAGFKKPRRKA